ncbi:drug resistance transporter, EmrB/QacA subfamily [Noviherbaspirillum humi]|uniref:Drug resistance transporter, EmrB/QacA subfamily n=1 Tax=Noviherbaspirillum humi TaxID=1688639 RepID=A0A239EXM4_9BURK|nr:MFS transporter [Noviherbaspirillum humi]SNS49181.1 drug resistance transporter, EmrB/QacA subfamily [Noviherbaspirillum humi]
MTQPSAVTAAGLKPAVSPWPTFWIASIAVLLVSIDTTVLYAAFGTLRKAFPAGTAADLSWVLNAYTVTYAAMLIPSGGLADVHGRKKMFLLGAAIFLIGSGACGAAGSIGMLIAARVVQAIGAALLTPASLSLILDAFPQQKRAVAVSLWGAVGGLAAAIGPSLGSFIVDLFGWSWAFYINLPIGAVSLIWGIGLLRESRIAGKVQHVDLVGMLLLIASVGGAALALTQSDAGQWTSGQITTVAAVAGAAFVAFIIWAARVPHPLVDLALFRSRTYSAVNLATFCFAVAFAMMFFAFFSYMTGIWHYSLPLAGIAVTPGPLMVVPTAIISGRLAAKHGHRPGLVIGSLVYAASGLWLALVPGTTPAYWTQWFPALMLSGIGVGMVLPSLSGAATARLPQHQYGVGSAVNQAVRQIGSVLGVALTVVLLGHETLARADFAVLYGMHVALALLTGLCCLAVDTRPRKL